MRRKKIGTMDFHGSVDITDPCYNRDVWCRMTDVKIRNGVYTCKHGITRTRAHSITVNRIATM